MSRSASHGGADELNAPGNARLNPAAPANGRRLWPVVVTGLLWLAGVAFLGYMTVLRFRVDPP